jgi:uncharacterized Zn-finger protein
MPDIKRLTALNEGHPFDFCANKNPKCPHCGDDFDIEDGEAWELYDDRDTHEVECPNCNLEFRVSSIAQWSFSTDEQEEDDA